jgi:hypothetical protein
MRSVEYLVSSSEERHVIILACPVLLIADTGYVPDAYQSLYYNTITNVSNAYLGRFLGPHQLGWLDVVFW